MTGFEVHRRSGQSFPVDNWELAPHDHSDANDIPKEGDSQIVGCSSPVASEYKRGLNERCRVPIKSPEVSNFESPHTTSYRDSAEAHHKPPQPASWTRLAASPA
jgi:hypothetical protein